MSRHRPTPAYRIPAGETFCPLHPAGMCGPDCTWVRGGPVPAPNVWLPCEPAVDPDDKLIPWERALSLVKNVVVIITCMVVLYTIWRGYVALAALGDSLDQLRSTWVTR